MDGLSADTSLQLTRGAQLLQQHTSGTALKALRSLGGKGSLLIETDASASYAEVQAVLSGVPGFRYVEPDFLINLSSTVPERSQLLQSLRAEQYRADRRHGGCRYRCPGSLGPDRRHAQYRRRCHRQRH